MAGNKTWMPLTAGILDIICGAWALLVSLGMSVAGGVLRAMALPEVPAYIGSILAILAIPFALLAILDIVGGVFALRRKIWGLALAGAISSLFSPYCFLLAIASIVFTAMSKSEFE